MRSWVVRYWFLVVACFIPVFFFGNRFLIPDVSFDVINYHLFLGMRGIQNFLLPFGRGEFFPVGGGSFATFFDIPFYVFRQFLGYRLGTSLGLISYWLVIFFTYKIITHIDATYFRRHRILGPLFFLNTIVVLELLFEIATYYIEIEMTALLLAVTYLVLKGQSYVKASRPTLALTFFGLSNILLSFAVIGKLTNVFLIVPIIILQLIVLAKSRSLRQLIKHSFIPIALLLLPILLYYGAIFQLTGNPIFPLYNKVFASPYYVNENYSFTSLSLGPTKMVEKIAWPVIGIVQPNRTGEIEALFHDDKLFITFFLILAVIIFYRERIQASLWSLIFLYFVTFLAWDFTTGYLRFATFQEIIGGIIFILLAPRLMTRGVVKFIVLTILTFFIVRDYQILQFNSIHDYSWRPPFLANQTLHESQLPFLFARHISLSSDRPVDVTLNCGVPDAGYTAVSPYRNKPMLLFGGQTAMWKYLASPQYQRKVKQHLVTDRVHFVTIVANSGLDPLADTCLAALKIYDAKIDQTIQLNDFLGYPNQKLTAIYGTFAFDK